MAGEARANDVETEVLTGAEVGGAAGAVVAGENDSATIVPKLTNMKIGMGLVAMDVSGSTGTTLQCSKGTTLQCSTGITFQGGRMTRIKATKKILSELGIDDKKKVIAWSSEVKYIPLHACVPGGGTYPSHVFKQGHLFVRNFETLPAIIFTTDGDIYKQEIEKMERLAKVRNTTVIAIMVNDRTWRPTDTNISVFLSLMKNSTNFIGIHYDGMDCRVMYAKGVYAKWSVDYSEGIMGLRWSDFPVITIEELRSLPIYTTNIPEGVIVTSYDVEKGVYNVLELDTIGPSDLINPDVRKALLDLSPRKLDELLKRLIAQIKKEKHIFISEEGGEIGVQLKAKKALYEQLKQMTCDYRRHLETEGDEEIRKEMLTSFKDKLAELVRMRNEIDQLKAALVEDAHSKFDEPLMYIDEMYRISAKYRNNVTLGGRFIKVSSNRAKRSMTKAKTPPPVPTHEHAVKGYCSLCLEEEQPLVFLLASMSDELKELIVKELTTDYVINFPLGVSHDIVQRLMDFLLVEPLSFEFAEGMVNMGQSLHRQAISGFITTDYTTSGNKKFNKLQLDKAWCGGSSATLTLLVLLRVLCAKRTVGWFTDEVKVGIINQLLNTLSVKNGFIPEERTVILRDAIRSVFKNEQWFLRQPVVAREFLSEFVRRFECCVTVEEVEMRKVQSVMYQACIVMKNRSVGERNKFVHLRNALCYRLMGGVIPKSGSFRIAGTDDAMRVLGVWGHYNTLCVDIEPVVATALLWAVNDVPRDMKPEAMWRVWSTKNTAISLVTVEMLMEEGNKMFLGYFKDAGGIIIPPFVINIGPYSSPSTIRDAHGRLFPGIREFCVRNKGRMFQIKKFMQVCREARSAYFKELYGAGDVGKTTSNYDLHRIVATVMYENEGAEDEVLFKMIMESIAKTCGKRGNIYNEDVVEEVRFAMASYKEMVSTTECVYNDAVSKCAMSYQFKFNKELEALGWLEGAYVRIPHSFEGSY